MAIEGDQIEWQSPATNADTIEFDPNALKELTGASSLNEIQGETSESYANVAQEPEPQVAEAQERVRINAEISDAEKDLADGMGETMKLAAQVKQIPPQVLENPSFGDRVGGFFADALEDPETSGKVFDAGGDVQANLTMLGVGSSLFAGGSEKGREFSDGAFNLGMASSLGGMALSLVVEGLSFLNKATGGAISESMRGRKKTAPTAGGRPTKVASE